LAWASSCSRSVTPTPAIGCEEARMIFDYSLAALVTAGLLFYLTYALLRPERF
jgi:K+-transporting ATPase KdpF subunit